MLGKLQGSHHCSTHATIQQDAPKHQETASPAELRVEVVTQNRQNAQSQGSAHGRHGVGKRPPPHKVLSEDGDGRLEAEAETKTCKDEQTTKAPVIYFTSVS